MARTKSLVGVGGKGTVRSTRVDSDAYSDQCKEPCMTSFSRTVKIIGR